jgi:cobalt-zinc-cadmium efflux system outer membrane protein
MPYVAQMNGLTLFAVRVIAAVCGTVVCAGLAAAQSGSAGTLSLTDALVLAREHAPGVLLAHARKDIAVGRVRESVQYPNPTLEYRRENLGSALPPDIFATLYVPIDITGRRWNLRSAGSAGQQRALADGQASARDAEIHVASVWLQAAAATAESTIMREFATAFAEVARVDSVRFAEGFVAEAVALRTQLEADRARVTLTTALTNKTRAIAQLARTMGVSAATVPAVSMLTAPELPVAPDTADAIRVALEHRPDVLARIAGVREADARRKAESRGVLGDWQLQGGSKQTSGFMTGQIGLAVPLPLFNRNSGARQRAAGELAEAQTLHDDTQRAARTDVLTALHAYNALQALAERVAGFAERGRELAAIARASYAEGHTSLVELLDAERAGADAQTARITWMVDAWMARLELERALGARLNTESPLDLPVLSALPLSSSLPR